jgi:hypothetical protein
MNRQCTIKWKYFIYQNHLHLIIALLATILPYDCIVSANNLLRTSHNKQRSVEVIIIFRLVQKHAIYRYVVAHTTMTGYQCI